MNLSENDLEFTAIRAVGQKPNESDRGCQVLHLPTGIRAGSTRYRTRLENKAVALRSLEDILIGMEWAGREPEQRAGGGGGMLSDQCIRRELESGRLVVTPLGERAIQPASVDVRLGETLKVPATGSQRALMGAGSADWFDFRINDGFKLMPGEFVLATTLEHVEIPADLCCLVHGRSSVGRSGLIIHTAGLVDPGFRGNITLELCNVSPRQILLTVGMGIAQLTFERLSSPAERPYGAPGLGSRYQDQIGVTEPRSATG